MTARNARAGLYQYHLKVVPTTYAALRGNTKLESNQYSVTEHYRPMDPALLALANVPPGVFFYYDLSAIKVRAGRHPAYDLFVIKADTRLPPACLRRCPAMHLYPCVLSAWRPKRFCLIWPCQHHDTPFRATSAPPSKAYFTADRAGAFRASR